MSRGVEGRVIFPDDSDGRIFLNILERRILQAGYLLYAWSLIPNHYHLCDTLNIKLEMVRVRGRQTVSSHARKLISFTAYRIYEIPVVRIAQYFKIRPQSVSELIKQGELLAKEYGLN